MMRGWDEDNDLKQEVVASADRAPLQVKAFNTTAPQQPPAAGLKAEAGTATAPGGGGADLNTATEAAAAGSGQMHHSVAVAGGEVLAQQRAEWASLLASSDALIGKMTVMRNLLAQKVARG